MTAVFAVFFLVLPATLFMVIEGKWNWIESFYFVFISLTTIGLGDYIPGTDSSYTICLSCQPMMSIRRRQF